MVSAYIGSGPTQLGPGPNRPNPNRPRLEPVRSKSGRFGRADLGGAGSGHFYFNREIKSQYAEILNFFNYYTYITF